MPDARISVLILAKNEAENLPQCLQTVNWANEVIVIVDRASRDETQSIAQHGDQLTRAQDAYAAQEIDNRFLYDDLGRETW